MWEEFVFNKYVTFWKCYYSIKGEPEKSTCLPDNVVKFMVIPGTKIKSRSHETFNFYFNSKKVFTIKFPKKNSVYDFKQLVKEYGIELLSLYGFKRYSDIPKLMKDSDNFECIEGDEFNIELSTNLTIFNINNSINSGITYFKANFNYI